MQGGTEGLEWAQEEVVGQLPTTGAATQTLMMVMTTHGPLDEPEEPFPEVLPEREVLAGVKFSSSKQVHPKTTLLKGQCNVKQSLHSECSCSTESGHFDTRTIELGINAIATSTENRA